MPKDFDQIQLTEQEKEYAIWNARCEKYFDLKEKEKKAQKQRAYELSRLPWTVKELKEYVLTNNQKFVVDSRNAELFELMCLYFSNDKRFETVHGYSLSKGLLLTGKVGVGKTELLRIFQKNKKRCYHLTSVYEIENYCQEHGVENYTMYSGFVPGWGGERFFYQSQIGWAWDDVGRESVVFDFGNKLDVFSKLIQVRYSNNVDFTSLHLTTNLSPDEIEAKYSSAVRSRLREMFNYIVVKGEDRRK